MSAAFRRGTGGRSSFSGVVATVFGATGFYGRYIINRLGRVGSQIVAPYRADDYEIRHLKPMGDLGQIVFPKFNLKDKESVAKAVRHSNVVINLVGRDYETRNFSFKDVHVDGARAIAEASRDAGVKRLVHFSALNAEHDSPSAFLRSKAQGEEEVKKAFPDVTIVRPSDTYGHEDRLFNSYAKLRMFRFVPLLDYGIKTYKNPVHVGDITRGTINIIHDPSTIGKTFEFAGPREYLLYDLVQFLFHSIYRRFIPVSPPKFLAQFVAFVLEQSPFIPYLTRDTLLRLHLSNTLTPGVPGLEDVGVTPHLVEDKALNSIRRFRLGMDFKKSMEDLSSPDEINRIIRKAE